MCCNDIMLRPAGSEIGFSDGTSHHFQHVASKKGQCTILPASAQLLHAPNTTIWSGEYLKIDVQSEVADTEIVLEPTNILRQWYHQCMSDNINTGTKFSHQVWFNSTRSPTMRPISCLQTSVLNFTTFNVSSNLCSNQLSGVTMGTLVRYRFSRVSPTQRQSTPILTRQAFWLTTKVWSAWTTWCIQKAGRYKRRSRRVPEPFPSYQKANRGYCLVTSFGKVAQYLKPQPALIPDVNSTLGTIVQWNYLIKTDLTQAFFQIPLVRVHKMLWRHYTVQKDYACILEVSWWCLCPRLPWKSFCHVYSAICFKWHCH